MTTDLVIPLSSEIEQIPGPEVAALFDASVKTGNAMTVPERARLAALLSANDRLDVAIPDDIDAGDLWETLALCCRVLRGTRQAGAQLKLLIGRALNLMKANPQLITEKGYRSFDQFITHKLPELVNISRPELYKALSVAKKFPTISMAEYGEIGSFNKLAAIAQVTSESDSGSGEWLQKAKEQTLDELKQTIYTSQHAVAEGALDFVTFQVTMLGDEKTRIEEFLADPAMQAYAESKSPGVMLCRAIEEATTEWKVQGEQGRN
jgi:hypothetical protein